MVAVILALVTALHLSPWNNARLSTYEGRPAVMVWTANWYVTEPQPSVRTRAFADLMAAHPGERLRICVRSAHDGPGTIWIQAQRLVGLVEFPHDTGLKTRCADVTVKNHPRAFPGVVEVSEGTYMREATDVKVTGWIKSVSIRRVP